MAPKLRTSVDVADDGGNMKTNTFFLLALLIIIAPALCAAEINIRIKAEVANIREKPDITSAVIRQLPKGTVFSGVEKIGSWYKVVFAAEKEAFTGYIHASTVEVLSSDVSAAPLSDTKQVAPIIETNKKLEKSAQVQDSTNEVGWILSKKKQKGVSPQQGELSPQKNPIQIYPGIILGVNLSSLSTGEFLESRFKIGYILGGYLLIPLKRNIELQPQALLISKGGKVVDSTQYAKEIYEWNMTYLEFPLLIRANLSLVQDRFALRPFLGPYISLKLSSTTKLNGKEDDLGELLTLDYGAIFGIGGKLMLKKNGLPLGIELRYEVGLRTIASTFMISGHKTRAISINMAYEF